MRQKAVELTTRGHHRSRSKRKKKGAKKVRETLARQNRVDEEEEATEPVEPD